MNKPIVYVASYDHQYVVDVRVFDTFAKAQAWKDELGAEWWSEVSDDPQPEDPCGDEYFELASNRSGGEEYFNIEKCEIE